MAKAVNIMGVAKGKLADSVLFELKNSSNKAKQGIREYVADVANPQTEAQAKQRVKLVPALRFYRALKSILSNSFEGIPYGGRSRQHFLHLVMQSNNYRLPYVTKDYEGFVPGEYPVSSGQLVSPLNNFGSLDPNEPSMSVSFIFPSSVLGIPSYDGTISQFSLLLSSTNSNYRDGDQLTFAFAVMVGGNIVVDTFSFVLDKRDNRYLDAILSNAYVQFDEVTREDVGFVFSFDAIHNPYDYIVGGCCIHSRRVPGPTVKWLRSNETFHLTPYFLSHVNSDEAYNRAVRSYQKLPTESTSDWLLNQARTPRLTSTLDVPIDNDDYDFFILPLPVSIVLSCMRIGDEWFVLQVPDGRYVHSEAGEMGFSLYPKPEIPAFNYYFNNKALLLNVVSTAFTEYVLDTDAIPLLPFMAELRSTVINGAHFVERAPFYVNYFVEPEGSQIDILNIPRPIRSLPAFGFIPITGSPTGAFIYSDGEHWYQLVSAYNGEYILVQRGGTLGSVIFTVSGDEFDADIQLSQMTVADMFDVFQRGLFQDTDPSAAIPDAESLSLSQGVTYGGTMRIGATVDRFDYDISINDLIELY